MWLSKRNFSPSSIEKISAFGKNSRILGESFSIRLCGISTWIISSRGIFASERVSVWLKILGILAIFSNFEIPKMTGKLPSMSECVSKDSQVFLADLLILPLHEADLLILFNFRHNAIFSKLRGECMVISQNIHFNVMSHNPENTIAKANFWFFKIVYVGVVASNCSVFDQGNGSH